MNKKWKAWLWVIAVFLAGAILGAVAGHLVTLSVARKAIRDPEFGRQLMMKRLDSRLDLAEDQRAAIDGIIRDAQVSIRDLRQEVQPRMTDILKNAETQITEVLHAGQQEEFRELLAERRKFWKAE